MYMKTFHSATYYYHITLHYVNYALFLSDTTDDLFGGGGNNLSEPDQSNSMDSQLAAERMSPAAIGNTHSHTGNDEETAKQYQYEDLSQFISLCLSLALSPTQALIID